MNITKCENGHFYDGDRYKQCPHCSAYTPIQDFMGQVVSSFHSERTLTGEMIESMLAGLIVENDDDFVDVDPVDLKKHYKRCYFCGNLYFEKKSKLSKYGKIIYCENCGAKLIECRDGDNTEITVGLNFVFKDKIRKILFYNIQTDILIILIRLYHSYKESSLFYKIENNALILLCKNKSTRIQDCEFKLFSLDDLGYVHNQIWVLTERHTESDSGETTQVLGNGISQKILFKDCSSSECIEILEWLLTHEPSGIQIRQKP